MSKYIKRDDVLKEIKAYIERAESCMENDGYYEAQFEGFEELQDDLFNIESTEVVLYENEDCISREQFREQMYHRCFEVDNDENMQKWESGLWIRYKLFEEELENAPSVVPSRPQGEWIVERGVMWPGDDIYGDMYHCSECGIRERDVDGHNFCLNCGADMRGESE